MSQPENHNAPQIENTGPQYGSDRSGLVHAFLFESGNVAESADFSSITEWLNRSKGLAPQSFAWLHFSLANAGTERWMRSSLDLPDTFYSILHENTGSTRLEQDGDALVAVIHDILFDFTFDPADVSTVTLFIGPHLLISARLKPLRSMDKLRAMVKAGVLFQSPVDLLCQLLRNQVAALVDIVRQSSAKVDTIEDNLLAERGLGKRRELGVLRRVLVRLQRLLAPEPAALFRLLNRPPEWIKGEDLQGLREAAEEFSGAVVDSTSLVERVKLLQEELSARVNEATNRTLFTLTMVTVLALPINMVAGLFGMNVGGIPMSQNQHGFAVVAMVVLAFTALVALLVFRHRPD
jgi:zinc transporter